MLGAIRGESLLDLFRRSPALFRRESRRIAADPPLGPVLLLGLGPAAVVVRQPRLPDLFDAEVAVDIQRRRPARGGRLDDGPGAPDAVAAHIGGDCRRLLPKNQPGNVA